MEKKTVKYHIPQHGIYMYARTNSGKTELAAEHFTGADRAVAGVPAVSTGAEIRRSGSTLGGYRAKSDGTALRSREKDAGTDGRRAGAVDLRRRLH